MSLPPEKLLGALAMAQIGTVAPALEGTYAGGSAATLGLLLVLLAQEVAARPARDARAAEAAGALLADAGVDPPDSLDARLAALDALLATTADPGLERRILDLYVEMSEAAFIAPPVMPQ